MRLEGDLEAETEAEAEAEARYLGLELAVRDKGVELGLLAVADEVAVAVVVDAEEYVEEWPGRKVGRRCAEVVGVALYILT